MSNAIKIFWCWTFTQHTNEFLTSYVTCNILLTGMFTSTFINLSIIDILLEFWSFCQSSEHRFPNSTTFASTELAPVHCPIRADGTLHSVPSALLYIYFVWQYLHFRTIEKNIYVVFKNVHNYLYLWTRYISCEGWNLSIIVQLTDDNIEKGRNSKKFGSTSPRWSRKIWPDSFMACMSIRFYNLNEGNKCYENSLNRFIK